MTSKRFLLLTGLTLALSALLLVGFNLAMDEFGIFRATTAGEKRVWTYNRATKYLFSLRYIPEDFDAILIGSSASAVMMDTRKLGAATTYNLSMNGANISEVAPAALNALERGHMRYLLVCLQPYLTKNSQMKTSELSPHLFQSTLGSLFTARFYLYKIYYSLYPEKDPYGDSWYGYRLLDPDRPSITGAEIEKIAQTRDHTEYVVDPKAEAALAEVLETARRKGVRIIGYFHPMPDPIHEAVRAPYGEYQARMRALFMPGEPVIDFNTPPYAPITGNVANFQDTVHLSRQGGQAVLRVLDHTMLQAEQ